MNISLTVELEKFVQEKVTSGMYNSASEVIREGLRLLKEQDMFRQMKLQELRKEIQRGIESGPTEPLDMEEIIREASVEFESEKRV